MKHFIITGATSGLGLVAARELASKHPEMRILVGARSPKSAEALHNAVPKDQLWISPLDTSSLRSVRQFSDAVITELRGANIDGLALNAGAQFVNVTDPTEDGYDLTFATNVLGHISLFRALEKSLSGTSVIVSTASGTHDENNSIARRSGFRGSFFPSANAVARGDYSTDVGQRQAGMDRYATSKLCNVMFTYAMARHFGENGPRFIALDPGMMPGTGLARDHSKAAQIAWKTVMPALAKLLNGASTPEQSGSLLADLLAREVFSEGTGLHIEYTRKEISSSDLSYDREKQDALIAFAEAAIAA